MDIAHSSACREATYCNLLSKFSSEAHSLTSSSTTESTFPTLPLFIQFTVYVPFVTTATKTLMEASLFKKLTLVSQLHYRLCFVVLTHTIPEKDLYPKQVKTFLDMFLHLFNFFSSLQSDPLKKLCIFLF